MNNPLIHQEPIYELRALFDSLQEVGTAATLDSMVLLTNSLGVNVTKEELVAAWVAIDDQINFAKEQYGLSN